MDVLWLGRLIQEEKQTTEARAEQLENRVVNPAELQHLMRPPGRPPLPLDQPSPPVSGRSTPNANQQTHSPQRDYITKYHTVRVCNTYLCYVCSLC